ncbi:uncharacterized protein [Rutidosis leptorrhynchoides]|uniref:uncharacterized protein n=1 Tax=Rutidosis leptorrhynchoides TaxID=125765 RepID=UPI003A993EAD
MDRRNASSKSSSKKIYKKNAGLKGYISFQSMNESCYYHNQSDRRRREKIDEKMKALQKLLANANKSLLPAQKCSLRSANSVGHLCSPYVLVGVAAYAHTAAYAHAAASNVCPHCHRFHVKADLGRSPAEK